MSHTKEPWMGMDPKTNKFRSTPWAAENENASSTMSAPIKSGRQTVALVVTDDWSRKDELLDNASRIVACVNACAGISTNELELMTGRMSIENQLKACDSLGNSAEEKAARRSKFARQRDKLLEVLKECDEAMVYMSEYDIPLCLPERVKAAIATVEGGAA